MQLVSAHIYFLERRPLNCDFSILLLLPLDFKLLLDDNGLMSFLSSPMVDLSYMLLELSYFENWDLTTRDFLESLLSPARFWTMLLVRTAGISLVFFILREVG